MLRLLTYGPREKAFMIFVMLTKKTQRKLHKKLKKNRLHIAEYLVFFIADKKSWKLR